MENKLVSVVITTYKRELKILKESLDSVLNQTYPLIEIIVVDDNGKDSPYAKENSSFFRALDNVNYVLNEKNSGAQFSRNKGILLSKGTYVAFLDDDDIWMPEKIEKQMALFEDSEVGLVFCDGYLFYEERGITQDEKYQKNPYFNQPLSFQRLLFNDYIGSTSQAIIRKECFAKVDLFDNEMSARQDYDMWLRISQFYKVIGISEALWYYRIHANERISTNNEKCLSAYKRILEKYEDAYKEYPYAKTKMQLRYAKINYKAGHKVLGIWIAIKSFVTSPACFYNTVFKHSMKYIEK